MFTDFKIQGSCSRVRRTPSKSSPTILATKLTKELATVLQEALAPSTMQAYRWAWSVFRSFLAEVMLEQELVLPYESGTICLFIIFLDKKGLKVTTITSYLSVVGYVQKILGITDPTQQSIVRQTLGGCKKGVKKEMLDVRLLYQC